MNTTQTTTTHADALTLFVARRAFDNHTRHALALPDVIPMPQWAASTYTNPAHIINAAHAAAFFALRARHAASGLQLMEDINRQQASDRQREHLPELAAQAEAIRSQARQHQQAAAQLDTIAERVSSSEAERAAAEQAATEHRAQRDRLTLEADTIEERIEQGRISDRGDISQAALIAFWNTGDFGLACKAAGKAIGAIAAAQGCTSTRTKVEPMTAEDVKQWRAMYGDTDKVPFAVREGTSAGYITIEQRNSPKFPAGFYKVRHYVTAAPYMSYEVFASSDSAAQLVTNGGINAILNQGDAAELEALFDRAKLAPREAQIVRYLADNTAAAAGARAVSDHQRETAERIAAAPDRKAAQQIQRRADARAESVRNTAQQQNAMQRAGITSERTQRDLMKRIREKLHAAHQKPEPIAPAELDRRQWARLQSNRQRASISAEAAPVDLLTWATIQGPDEDKTHKDPAIRWTRRPYPAEFIIITPEQAAQEEQQRREYISSHAADIALLDIRRDTRDAAPTTAAEVIEYTRSNRTPATIKTTRSANSARFAAWAFTQDLTPAEVAAGMAAEAAAQAAARAAAQAEADKLKAEAAARKAAEAARLDALCAHLDKLEAAQQRRNAADAARAAQEAAEAEARRQRYNNALRAALLKMGITWTKATPEQRQQATTAARAAME